MEAEVTINSWFKAKDYLDVFYDPDLLGRTSRWLTGTLSILFRVISLIVDFGVLCNPRLANQSISRQWDL